VGFIRVGGRGLRKLGKGVYELRRSSFEFECGNGNFTALTSGDSVSAELFIVVSKCEKPCMSDLNNSSLHSFISKIPSYLRKLG
jgi:hypothetical protein